MFKYSDVVLPTFIVLDSLPHSPPLVFGRFYPSAADWLWLLCAKCALNSAAQPALTPKGLEMLHTTCQPPLHPQPTCSKTAQGHSELWIDLFYLLSKSQPLEHKGTLAETLQGLTDVRQQAGCTIEWIYYYTRKNRNVFLTSWFLLAHFFCLPHQLLR